MTDRLPRSLNLPELPRQRRVSPVGSAPEYVNIEYVRTLNSALRANHVQIVDRVEELVNAGDHADRPDATGAGKIYYSSDTEVLYLDDGTWNEIGGAHTHDHGGGELTGLGDDDHSAYLLASDATNRATFAANWLDLTDAGATTLHSHALGPHTHTESDITDLDHDDTDAIHDNVANEITAITAKTTIVDADEFLLEDSEASPTAFVKKAVTAANLKTYIVGAGAYLPLVAGSGNALTGELHINDNGTSLIRLAQAGNANYYSEIFDDYTASSALQIQRRGSSGTQGIDLSPIIGSGTHSAIVSVFAVTDTSAACEFRVNKGDGTGSVNNYLRGYGDANFCLLAGDVNIGAAAGAGTTELLNVNGSIGAQDYIVLGYLGAVPSSPRNGMIWMESDGLHLYYSGAEQVVAVV